DLHTKYYSRRSVFGRCLRLSTDSGSDLIVQHLYLYIFESDVHCEPAMELQGQDALVKCRGAVVNQIGQHVTVDAVGDVVALDEKDRVIPLTALDRRLGVVTG